MLFIIEYLLKLAKNIGNKNLKTMNMNIINMTSMVAKTFLAHKYGFIK